MIHPVTAPSHLMKSQEWDSITISIIFLTSIIRFTLQTPPITNCAANMVILYSGVFIQRYVNLACNATSKNIKASFNLSILKYYKIYIGVICASFIMSALSYIIHRALFNKLCKESALTNLAIKMIPISLVHNNQRAKQILDSIV
jgi:hypothetical protein